ncbi:hypothetical protein L484_022911 [Morus notabilis]|uniref:Uncharacterized protein n=1 Tax=Morus notabilis TaxID=981085 RepID=W9RVG4_9ROSA|nr:hypothetical protein L484_022911 [Morus notabilis]
MNKVILKDNRKNTRDWLWELLRDLCSQVHESPQGANGNGESGSRSSRNELMKNGHKKPKKSPFNSRQLGERKKEKQALSECTTWRIAVGDGRDLETWQRAIGGEKGCTKISMSAHEQRELEIVGKSHATWRALIGCSLLLCLLERMERESDVQAHILVLRSIILRLRWRIA